MDKNVKGRLIKRSAAVIILIGVIMILIGLIFGEILNYSWFKSFIPNGILVIISPIFIGLIYILTCESFGINDDEIF